jgi:hypothetical protein
MSLGVHHPETGRNTGAVSGRLDVRPRLLADRVGDLQIMATKAVTLNVTIRPAMRMSVFIMASWLRAEAVPNR